MTSQFTGMALSPIFFDVILFLLSSLVNGPSFMSISSLVLELWQFSFIIDLGYSQGNSLANMMLIIFSFLCLMGMSLGPS